MKHPIILLTWVINSVKQDTSSPVLCDKFSSVQFISVAQSCPTLWCPMDCSTPGLPGHHQFQEFHAYWVGDAIQPSHPLLSPSPPALNLSQNQGLFKWVPSSHQVAIVLSFSFNISPSNEYSGVVSFRMDWLDLLAIQGNPKSLFQHHSSKASILWCSVFFIVQLSHPYMTTGKTIALTRQSFVGKILSLIFSMLSRLVITFLPRSKGILILRLQSPSEVILEPPKIKSTTVSNVSPSICYEVMGLDAVILVFWMLSFKLTFSLYYFTFIKRLFCSSLLFAIKVVSSTYLRILIFLPGNLISACASSRPAFLMMYSI